MGDIRTDGVIRFLDGTLLAANLADPRLLFWACLGKALCSSFRGSVPPLSTNGVSAECEREFDWVVRQVLAQSTADLNYHLGTADEFARCCKEILESGLPKQRDPEDAPWVPDAHLMHPLVVLARKCAVTSHDACGHTRSDGTPYWTHPERVAKTLAAHGLSPEVLAAAWLHDVAEDCPADEAGSRELLGRFKVEFGADVASLVTEVTNYFGPEATMEQKQARLREHARTMSDGAKWIKLADRLDNITGMVGWSPEKRCRYASATLLLLEALKPWPAGSESLTQQISDVALRLREADQGH